MQKEINIEDKIKHLQDRYNHMVEQLIQIKFDYKNQVEKYEQLLLDSIDINQKLHLKTFHVEELVQLLSKRFDIELDNYVKSLLLLETKIQGI